MKCYNETKDAVYYLVYEFDEEDGIDQTAAGMISNNNIKGIMPFTITQMDSCVKVRYDITAMISVSQWLNEYTCKERVINVLDTVMSVFEQSENYLLDYNSVILDCQKIFYNVKSNEIWMVLLPVLDKNIGNPSLSDFLKSFVCSLNADQNENCDYIGKMLAYLNGKTEFSAPDFRFIIDEQKIHFIPEHNEINIAVTQNEKETEQEAPEQKSEDKEDDIKFTLVKHDQNDQLLCKQEEKKLDDTRNAAFKMPLNIYADDEKESTENKSRKSLFSKLFGESRSKARSSANEQFTAGDKAEEGHIDLQFLDSSGNVSSQNIVDAAMILENSAAQNPSSFLLRIKNNEKIPIKKNTFRLGTDKRIVDYCINDNHAVSRSHAQIILKNGAYFIIDNDSTNHTYLNDHLIKSEHEMKLLDRSRIRLANEEFIFYV